MPNHKEQHLNPSISREAFEKYRSRLKVGDKVVIETSAETYSMPFEIVGFTDDGMMIATTYASVRNRDDYTPAEIRPAHYFEDVDVVMDIEGAHPASVMKFSPDG